MANDGGGPAFPAPGTTGYEQNGAVAFVNWPGMSLRDYFAGKVMGGLLAAVEPKDQAHLTGRLYSEIAYRIADAMLAERDK